MYLCFCHVIGFILAEVVDNHVGDLPVLLVRQAKLLLRGPTCLTISISLYKKLLL